MSGLYTLGQRRLLGVTEIKADPKSGSLQIHADGVEDIGRVFRTGGRVLSGVITGAVLAPVLLALLWKSHRILGAILGLIGGPFVGGGIGLAFSAGDLKKLKESENTETRKQLPAPSNTSGGDSSTRGASSASGIFKAGDKVRGPDITGKIQNGVVKMVNSGGSGTRQLFVDWADGSGSIAAEEKLEKR